MNVYLRDLTILQLRRFASITVKYREEVLAELDRRLAGKQQQEVSASCKKVS